LVNNAGASARGHALDISDETWQVDLDPVQALCR
jgi:hypothetical protein